MKKLVIALVGLLMIVTLTSAAVPSVTTDDINQVTGIEAAVEVAADFAIAVVEDKPAVTAELNKIYAFVQEGKAPIEYFASAELETAVAAKLPEGTDLKKLQLNEFMTIGEFNYDQKYGEVKATFTFVTKYKANQKLVAVVGFYTDEKDADGNYIVEWVALDAVADASGNVQVIFTEDVLARMGTTQATSLAILSE